MSLTVMAPPSLTAGAKGSVMFLGFTGTPVSGDIEIYLDGQPASFKMEFDPSRGKATISVNTKASDGLIKIVVTDRLTGSKGVFEDALS